MPTGDNLLRRHINPSFTCPLCQQQDSTLHLMLFCPLTRCLTLHFLGLMSNELNPTAPAQILCWLAEPPPSWPALSANSIRTLLLCWDVCWTTRNNILYKSSPTPPTHILINSIRNRQLAPPPSTPHPPHNRILKPFPSFNFHHDFLIITNDAFWSDSLTFSWAYLIWDKNGLLIAHSSGEGRGGSAQRAELLAILHAIKDPSTFGATSTKLVLTDCFSLVAGLESPVSCILVENLALYYELLSLCNSRSVTLNWAGRTYVASAHNLCRLSHTPRAPNA